MKTFIRNFLAVLAGLAIGSVVNMGFIVASAHVIPPPTSADVTTMEGLKASLHLFEPKHFIFPFLAHAMGTLVGANVAAFLAASHQLVFAMVIGLLFLAGGIANVLILPSPLWFSALDLICAYLPMAWIGWKLASLKASRSVR